MKWKNLQQGYSSRIEQMARLSPRELLGIDTTASKDDIKAAYLRLVKAYHPDKADPFMEMHNLEMTKLINAAYEKLKDGAR